MNCDENKRQDHIFLIDKLAPHSANIQLVCDFVSFPTLHVVWDEMLLSTETNTYAVVSSA